MINLSKVSFILVMCIFTGTLLYCTGIQESPNFKKKIPGLIKIVETKDFPIASARFTSDNESILVIGTNKITGEDSTIKMMDLSGKLHDSPFKEISFPYQKNEYFFDSFYLIDSKTILQTNTYVENNQRKEICIKIDINTIESTEFIILPEIILSWQSQENRNLFMNKTSDHKGCILINIEDNSIIHIKPVAMILKRFPDGMGFAFGKDSNEIIIIGNDVNDNKGYFLFYNYNTNKIIKEFKVDSIYSTIRPSITGILRLSPDKRYFAMIYWRNGLWLWDTETWEFIKVFDMWNPCNLEGAWTQLDFCDWSWDSKKLLLTIGGDLFILDIEEFLASNPERIQAE